MSDSESDNDVDKKNCVIKRSGNSFQKSELLLHFTTEKCELSMLS